jgi:hypothetical protein
VCQPHTGTRWMSVPRALAWVRGARDACHMCRHTRAPAIALTVSNLRLLHWSPTTRKLVLPLTAAAGAAAHTRTRERVCVCVCVCVCGHRQSQLVSSYARACCARQRLTVAAGPEEACTATQTDTHARALPRKQTHTARRHALPCKHPPPHTHTRALVTRPPKLSTRSLAASRNRLDSTPLNTNALPVNASGWPCGTSCWRSGAGAAGRQQGQHGVRARADTAPACSDVRWHATAQGRAQPT